MNPIREECKHLINTTYRREYIPKEIKPTQEAKPFTAVCEDPVLINGQFLNNLHVDNKPGIYTVDDHPFVKNKHEKYEDYVEKIISQDDNPIQKCFKGTPINKALLKDQLVKLNKSCYQNCYSPDKYCSIKEKVRLKNCDIGKPPGWKNHCTTYLASYNRIEEVGDKKDVALSENCKPQRTELESELRRIYKTGKTVYYTEICEPALFRIGKLRSQNVLKESPLDRYTLRRV